MTKVVLIALIAVAIIAWFRRPARSRLGTAEARALLGLRPGADPDTIRAAHRRLIQRVHPDTGGSTELARRINAARDLLLKSR